MLNRFTVELNDGKGTTRSLYTNAAGLVNIELQSQNGDKLSVRVTPLTHFDDSKHFLVQVNEDASGKSVKRSAVVLRGITPGWLNSLLATVPDPRQFGAICVAESN